MYSHQKRSRNDPRTRQKAKRNYTVQDVFNIIEKGSLGLLQTSEKSGEERYEIIGNDLDSHPGAVIVEISSGRDKIILITVKGGVSRKGEGL